MMSPGFSGLGARPVSYTHLDVYKRQGVNYGFSTSPLMVASVCGPFIGGLIRAWSGDYLVALYVAAAITLLGVAPAVVLREKAHKRESVAREGCPSPASLSSQNG